MSSYPSHPGTQSTRRRFVFWMGVLSLLLSVMSPALTLYASDAAANAAAVQGVPPDCEEGYVDDGQGTCVPADEYCSQQGLIYDQNSGQCLTPDEYCGQQGLVYDPGANDCVEQQADPMVASLSGSSGGADACRRADRRSHCRIGKNVCKQVDPCD